MSTPRNDSVHQAIQRALTLIEDKANGRPLDLDLNVAEMALLLSSLITIGASMATSFNRSLSDVIESLRMLALKAVD